MPPAPSSPLAAPVPSHAIPPRSPQPRPRVSSFASLLVVVACVTAADLLLKRGAVASHAGAGTDWLTRLGLAALLNPFTIVGILFHLAGLAAWLTSLRRVPLTVAYCFTALQQATIALGAWLWLGELITPLRWCGIAIVAAGVLVLVPGIVNAEERTQPAAGAP